MKYEVYLQCTNLILNTAVLKKRLQKTSKYSKTKKSKKTLLWSTQNKNILILFFLKTYELLVSAMIVALLFGAKASKRNIQISYKILFSCVELCVFLFRLQNYYDAWDLRKKIDLTETSP